MSEEEPTSTSSSEAAPAQTKWSRRSFLKAGLAAGGGLLVACGWTFRRKIGEYAFPPSREELVQAWLRIEPSGQVTCRIGSSEMGQGVFTSLTQLLIEELGADWDKVKVEASPAGAEYRRPGAIGQYTGGSTSVRHHFVHLREVGATARQLLVNVAAKRWGRPALGLTVADGVVRDPASGETLGFGDLAEDAARAGEAGEVPLKPPGEWRLVGRSLPRKDIPDKVRGAARFGIDTVVEGMVYAAIRQAPSFGGEVTQLDEAAASKAPGVLGVYRLPGAVAVVADKYWRALQAVEGLDVQFGDGSDPADSAELERRMQEGLAAPAEEAHSQGDLAALRHQPPKLTATYSVPFLAHATLEPQNCTARVAGGKVEVWAPTQAQESTRDQAAAAAGVGIDDVTVHTTMLGGGFGRRFETDFVVQAVTLAKKVGRPVKLIWSREEDTQHDFYRPAARSKFEAWLASDGTPSGWFNRLAAPSILERVFPLILLKGPDPTSVEGAHELPYAIPSQRIEYARIKSPVPLGFWRSVGSSKNAFFVEGFLDECAHAAGVDPVEYRRRLLKAEPRFTACLERAAQEAGWGSPLPAGRGRGVALHKSFGTIVCQVAEVSVQAGEVRVHRVTCAVDCGRVVNPDGVIQQTEGGVVFGLTAALYGEITLDRGRVEQSNFHDYPLLKFDRMPVVDVHLIESGEDPGGAGEPATPPVAPAVCNALFAATGRRIRDLPLANADLEEG